MAKAPKGPKKGNGNIETGERFKRMLPCPISAVIKQRKKDETFDIDGEIEVEQEHMVPFKTRIKELHAQKRQLRKDINTMTEEREVFCVEERDYAHREIRVRRIDTREVVESRTMTDADRSPELPIPDLPEGAPRPTKGEKAGKPTKAAKGGKGKVVPLHGAEAIAAARAESKPEGKGDGEEEEEEEADDQGA